MPLPTCANSLCRLCSRFLAGSAEARRRKPTVKFLLDQCGVFQQSNDFGPDDLIEQILAEQSAVVANRTTQFSPAIGTNTFVVVDFASLVCVDVREKA